MPFLGTTPTQGFVSSFPKQSFTPDGSTTAFTLTNPVATANDLEVFVGNVRQEPTTAYTAAGTTLTMSEAPASGLNFYVINKSFAQVTTNPPDGSVSTAKLDTNAVTTAKIANSAITDAKIAGVASTKLSGTLPVARFPTGTVLQIKGDMNQAAVTNNIQGFTDSGLTVTMTPSSATNYFMVLFEGHFSQQSVTGDKGFGFNIYKDGTAVTGSPNDLPDRQYDWYQDDSGNGERYFLRHGKTYYAQTGTTSAVTFTVSFTSYLQTSGPLILGTGNQTQQTLIVYEIQG